MADDETTPTPEPQVPEVTFDETPPAPAKKRRRKQTAAERRGEEGPPKIDDYPDRPYLDAVTPEHRKALEEAGQLPKGR